MVEGLKLSTKKDLKVENRKEKKENLLKNEELLKREEILEKRLKLSF